MLMRRDFDLNSVDAYADSTHVYNDSPKEAFRKTMLSQEIVFKNQVQELHRIYQMQMMLMQGDNWMEFNQYNLSEVDVAHSESQGFFHRFQQRSFGCKVPANHYAGHVDHPDNLKLSPRVGDGNKRKQSGKRTWFNLEFTQEVIDLEESTETISNNDSGNEHSFGSAALTVNSGSKLESQKSVLTELVISSGPMKDQANDFERCNCISSSEKQQISSYGTLDFDLNKVYCDDSTCHSNDLMITYPLTVSSSDPFHELFGSTEDGSSESHIGTRECDNSSDETCDIPQPNNAQTSLLANAEGNYERTESSARHLIFDELHISEEVLGPSQELGCHKNGTKDGTVECTLNVSPCQFHPCSATKEANIDKGEMEDDTLACSDHSHIDSALPEHCYVGDNESSNAETAHSKGELENPLSCEKLLTSSCKSKEDHDEVDNLVREAAESLIQITFESLACCYQDCSGIENKETTATPQCSIDSFERFTLGLKDCAKDDMCVSSKLVEVDLSENKDYGLKIRRGRRLKDFQRDILPGLASLSRHEICEDVNILEGVLRSREYRKMRGKMADYGQNSWCVSARSKRPRLSCSKRRRYS